MAALVLSPSAREGVARQCIVDLNPLALRSSLILCGI